ncbi:MAG: recombination mediator RecR [Eubacteriales bacterium]
MSDTPSSSYIPPLENLAAQFRKLPGIGKKSAYRMAFAVLDFSESDAAAFAEAILAAKRNIMRCKCCQNISDTEICPICADSKRNHRQICVVEDPRDVAAIVKINEYEGVFHVLGGLISPLTGKTPDMLTVKELLNRVNSLLASEDAGEKPEIILATNPSVEGDATAMYLSRLIKPLGVKVTRLAYGIPVGGDLEYADDVTLSRAISGRSEML